MAIFTVIMDIFLRSSVVTRYMSSINYGLALSDMVINFVLHVFTVTTSSIAIFDSVIILILSTQNIFCSIMVDHGLTRKTHRTWNWRDEVQEINVEDVNGFHSHCSLNFGLLFPKQVPLPDFITHERMSSRPLVVLTCAISEGRIRH